MRIAFTSCFSSAICPDQPVWAWIEALRPDHLVLLGDSIYMDVPVVNDHPKTMLDNDFAQHMHQLYRAQLAQPQFLKLLKAMGPKRVWSTWDDHDFLWNNAWGAHERNNPLQRDKVRISTAFQEAFRAAVASGDPLKHFPTSYTDIAFWNPAQPPLTHPSIALGGGVWLHLSDGRTHRTRPGDAEDADRTMLGRRQREQFDQAFEAHPNDVHLFASASTLGDYKKDYPIDWQWLKGRAAKSRTLALTGDLHRNESDVFETGGRPLHEATSSGAGVRSLVALGKEVRNHGLVVIDADHVQVRLFNHNAEETAHRFRIDRSTWLR